jgi:hypothetical protein
MVAYNPYYRLSSAADDQSSMLAAQDASFGNEGYASTGSALLQGLRNSYSPQLYTNTTPALDVYPKGMDTTTGGDGEKGGSLWGDIKGAFSDDGKGANFGRNLLGAGQLGLGLMSYLEQKPMMEKQNRLLDQQIANNEREGAARQATRDALSAKV